MEIQGVIKLIGSTNKISDKFSKRDLRITTEGDYPQTIEVQFVNDKCVVLDKFKVGEQVSVSINLRGREWTNPQGETKYFNSIQGWRIEKLVAEQPAQQMPPMPAAEAFEPATNFNEEEHDDLPF